MRAHACLLFFRFLGTECSNQIENIQWVWMALMENAGPLFQPGLRTEQLHSLHIYSGLGVSAISLWSKWAQDGGLFCCVYRFRLFPNNPSWVLSINPASSPDIHISWEVLHYLFFALGNYLVCSWGCQDVTECLSSPDGLCGFLWNLQPLPQMGKAVEYLLAITTSGSSVLSHPHVTHRLVSFTFSASLLWAGHTWLFGDGL